MHTLKYDWDKTQTEVRVPMNGKGVLETHASSSLGEIMYRWSIYDPENNNADMNGWVELQGETASTLQVEHVSKKEAVFILLFIMCTNYSFTIENGKRTLMFSNIQDLLQIIRKKILNIFTKNVKPLSDIGSRSSNRSTEQSFESKEIQLIPNDSVPLFTPALKHDNNDKESMQLTFSEWSNWSLKQLENDSLKFYKHFDFLPQKLHKLLRGNTKLTKTEVLNEYNGSTCSTKLKSGLQSKHFFNLIRELKYEITYNTLHKSQI